MEFVIGFIIPFNNFKIATKSIWEKSQDKQRVSTVFDNLNDNRLTVSFPYYEEHKGDLWDCLENSKETDASKAFRAIVDFVHYAKMLDRGMLDLSQELERYIAENTDPTATLAKFLSENKDCEEKLNKGKHLISDIGKCIQDLPLELEIIKMSEQLSREN